MGNFIEKAHNGIDWLGNGIKSALNNGAIPPLALIGMSIATKSPELLPVAMSMIVGQAAADVIEYGEEFPQATTVLRDILLTGVGLLMTDAHSKGTSVPEMASLLGGLRLLMDYAGVETSTPFHSIKKLILGVSGIGLFYYLPYLLQGYAPNVIEANNAIPVVTGGVSILAKNCINAFRR